MAGSANHAGGSTRKARVSKHMRCGVCGDHYGERTMTKHFMLCEDEGLAPTPTINDIKKNQEESEANA
jgi:hypothetical protein